MKAPHSQRLPWGVLSLLMLLQSTASWASPATLFVAANGLDTSNCGSRHPPCRSISQAIAQASDYDWIRVGPGRYGDLNRDGRFDAPGEERAEIGTGCGCMIKIDKPLTLISSKGAQFTLLDAAQAPMDAVKIMAKGITFGQRLAGFTLTGAATDGEEGGNGLVVADVKGVRIAGNHSVSNQGAGFLIKGKHHKLTHNLAMGNGTGFLFAFTEQGHRIHHNRALNNGHPLTRGHGFSLFGNGHLFTNNHSLGNQGAGIVINATSTVDWRFYGNTLTANTGPGAYLLSAPGLRLWGNTLYANLGLSALPQVIDTPNCGLVNLSGDTSDARFNYWGARSGPGDDPADSVGQQGLCDQDGETRYLPFLRRSPWHHDGRR